MPPVPTAFQSSVAGKLLTSSFPHTDYSGKIDKIFTLIQMIFEERELRFLNYLED